MPCCVSPGETGRSLDPKLTLSGQNLPSLLTLPSSVCVCPFEFEVMYKTFLLAVDVCPVSR